MSHKRRSPRAKQDGWLARHSALEEIGDLFRNDTSIIAQPYLLGRHAMKIALEQGCSREFAKLARIAWRQAAVRRTSASTA